MKIEKAIHTDAKALTALTIRSKAHWDYSAEQIEIWKPDLTISAEYIATNAVFVLNDREQLIGYYSYLVLDEVKMKLDNIFIDPTFIGKGYGKILMEHLLSEAKQKGFDKIVLDSEPNAEAFYHKFGFKVIGQLETSIKNRFLPIMELSIKST